MNFEEAVHYIESRSVFGAQPGFERINGLLDRLGHPEKGLKYVHVAGTNGKGSVCTETANILTAAGYKTGLFTSPYVADFRERIRINGRYIEKEVLAKLTSRVKGIVEELSAEGIEPTEFEVITAIGFLYFKQSCCDVVVLEVGLGGLLDSTNVIEQPLVCAITSLSMDHTAVLGKTIAEIATQKAGIIKTGVPVVTAANQPSEALFVLKETALKKATNLIISDPSIIPVVKETIHGTTLLLENEEMRLPLIGDHQLINLAITLEIVKILREKGYDIETKDLKLGLERTVIPARQEILSKKPLVILDGGHNKDGVAALSKSLTTFTEGKRRILVLGVMADKEVDAILKMLIPLADHIITTTPNSDRSMPAADLAKALVDAGMPKEKVSVQPIPTEAFDEACKEVRPEDCLVVCGSLYLAGDVRAHMEEKLNPKTYG